MTARNNYIYKSISWRNSFKCNVNEDSAIGKQIILYKPLHGFCPVKYNVSDDPTIGKKITLYNIENLNAYESISWKYSLCSINEFCPAKYDISEETDGDNVIVPLPSGQPTAAPIAQLGPRPLPGAPPSAPSIPIKFDLSSLINIFTVSIYTLSQLSFGAAIPTEEIPSRDEVYTKKTEDEEVEPLRFSYELAFFLGVMIGVLEYILLTRFFDCIRHKYWPDHPDNWHDMERGYYGGDIELCGVDIVGVCHEINEF